MQAKNLNNTIRNKLTTGALWSFAEQFGRRGITAVVTILLAHYIAPQDFGLISILAVVIALANALMDAGIKEAIIRLHEPSLVDLDTAFYANLIFSVFACLIILLSAPYISEFYGEPRLKILIEVASLSIIPNAIQVVPSAVLIRNLDFKRQFKVNLLATALATILTLALAANGAGAWALVCQMLASAFFAAVITWQLKIWRPAHQFSMQSFVQLFKFGYKITLSGLLEIIFSNMYVLVIAKILMGAIVGLYFFAEKIRDMLVTQLVNSIQIASYPVLSGFQYESCRLKDGYRKVIIVTTFIVFPSMFSLAALADPLFKSMLPQRWWGGAPYLQLLCIAGAFYPLHAINLNILKVKGRSDLYLYIEVIKKVLAAIIFSITIWFGIYAVLVGQIIWSALAFIPNSFFSAKLIKYPPSSQVGDVFPAFLISIFSASITYLFVEFVNWPELAKLLVFGAASFLVYVGTAKILKLEAYTLTRDSLGKVLADNSCTK